MVKLSSADLNDAQKIEALNEFFDAQCAAQEEEVQSIQNDYSMTPEYAAAIWYLRTRSRWTQELEEQLVSMCRANDPCPNMNEWP